VCAIDDTEGNKREADMRRFMATLSLVVLTTFVASPSWAQQPPPTPIIQDGVTVEARSNPEEKPVLDKKFWTVAIALNAAQVMDTKSTFDVFARCNKCYEANPYARPFVNRGPAVAFTAGQAFDIGLMYTAAKMKGSKHPVFRNIWWVIPVSMTIGHLAAYQHNIHVAR
jgi:hypothetical protein